MRGTPTHQAAIRARKPLIGMCACTRSGRSARNSRSSARNARQCAASDTLRFHLHPDVNVSLQQDGEAVLLRLRSGGGWRLRADGARMSLEESIYLGGHEPRRSEQVVLTGYADGPQQVKWAISKVG